MQTAGNIRAGRITTALSLARQALGDWGSRQLFVAAIGALGTALVIGLATVLIPNSIFGRDIPPVWWDYPVWILTSILCGVLIATYVDPTPATADDTAGTETVLDVGTDRRSSRMGMAGGVLAWFAVGCPVCNKIALVALGYSGAMTWFAPVQPLLAVLAIALTGIAIVLRLEGQVVCRLPDMATRTPVRS